MGRRRGDEFIHTIVRMSRFRGKGSMPFADFRLILYPAILTIRLLIVCIWLLSFVGCGGAPAPVSSPSPKDFGIALSPATITAIAGGSQSTFAVSTTAQNGFANAVMVTLSGLPAGATASPASPFSVPAGGSQTVTLSIPATVSAGNFTLTASGTSAALTHSASLTLTVDPVADFSIVLSAAALTVNAGASNSFTVSITGQGGFTGSVAVTLAGLPAGATTSPASPFTVAAGSSQPVAVSVSVPATVFAANFPLTVSGTSAALAHSVQLILTVLGQMQVTTWHYDVERTSANLWETVLTPSNVNSASFGKLFTQPVDGYVVGHPLYLPAGLS